MKQSRIRVLLVEDDPILLECLQLEIAQAPSLRCVGAYSNFEEGQKAISHKLPDVILMDLSLPGGMDGIAATQAVRRQWPRVKIIVFTGHSDKAKIYAALEAGAHGFLIKSGTRAELIAGIEQAYEGGAPVSAIVSNTLVDYFAARGSLIPHLSPTERLILDLYERGLSQKEIAGKLGMSIGTVRTHANRVLDKFHVSSMVRAAHLRRQLLN